MGWGGMKRGEEWWGEEGWGEEGWGGVGWGEEGWGGVGWGEEGWGGVGWGEEGWGGVGTLAPFPPFFFLLCFQRTDSSCTGEASGTGPTVASAKNTQLWAAYTLVFTFQDLGNLMRML